MAGLRNKDEEFMRNLKDWEVIVMCETWVVRKGWDAVRNRLPKEYKWETQWAKGKNRKGRALGGMVMGIREGIEIKKEREREEREGIIMNTVRSGKWWWRIVGVYVNKDIEEKLEMLRLWLEEKEERIRVVIGGDFNARTGVEDGRIWEGEEEGKSGDRESKDKK